MSEKYSIPVLPINCIDLTEKEIREIISNVLYEFPIKEIAIQMPNWISYLRTDHWLKNALCDAVLASCKKITRIREIKHLTKDIKECDYVENADIGKIDLGSGCTEVEVKLDNSLFYKIITEISGLKIDSDESLINNIKELAEIKRDYDRFRDAINQVEATGYGIVMPTIDELTLEEPEIMRQGSRYGVRLRASAPSIHLMKADITTEVNPIVGSEKQSEDLVMSLLKDFEEDPIKIWDSNIFGKSLNELVNEGLHTKLARMPEDARVRLQETLERVINEGCSGLICIIL